MLLHYITEVLRSETGEKFISVAFSWSDKCFSGQDGNIMQSMKHTRR